MSFTCTTNNLLDEDSDKDSDNAKKTNCADDHNIVHSINLLTAIIVGLFFSCIVGYILGNVIILI
jgi:hypothetical protein